MYKVWKFRLYPSIEQQILINKNMGCCRLVFNTLLDKKLNNEKMGKYDLINLIPELKKEKEFLKEVESSSLQNVVTDLMNGYDRYNSGLGGKPRFKKKGTKESYRINCVKKTYKDKEYENITLDLMRRKIKLPKLGLVDIRGYRKEGYFPYKIINVTITKEAGRYYISVLFECDNISIANILPPKTKKQVGIDIGVKNLVVTSDNRSYGKITSLEKCEKRIKKLAEELSRKVKGSNNYIKTKIKLERAYQKLRNSRKYQIDEIVSELVYEYDVIVTENLKVQEMIKKGNNSKKLRKNIIHSTFSTLIRKLKYKCEWANKKFLQVNTYYPSSQICSCCGNRDNSMKDSRKRKYRCIKCGLELDRDYNASINILNEGRRIYSV